MNISRPAENRRIKAEYRHWRSEGRNLGIMVNGISEFFKGISEAIERSGSGRE